MLSISKLIVSNDLTLMQEQEQVEVIPKGSVGYVVGVANDCDSPHLSTVHIIVQHDNSDYHITIEQEMLDKLFDIEYYN